jgi:hypothetical protein
MFFIESGQVEVVRGCGPDARVLAELEAGDLFGEMALLTGNARSATVTAISDLNLWTLARDDFETLVGSYPNLALALSRLLSERLRTVDERLLARPIVPPPVAALPQPCDERIVVVPPAPPRAPQPRPVARAAVVARPAPKPVRAARPAPTKPARSLTAELTQSFEGAVTWFNNLSRTAKVRLVLITVLLAWLVCIVVPAMLISSLAAERVTNLQGAIAFVQTMTPVPTETAIPSDTPIPPSDTPVPPTGTPMPTETPLPPTETPPPTDTPLPPPTDTPLPPPTDTPLPPPTETPIPPTAVPAAPRATPKPQPQAAAAAAPAEKPQPPRDLDPRLSALNVGIQPANVPPGQHYWRLVRAYWQNKEESGNDHTIYIEVLDENGSRIIGQPVEIRWQGGNLTVLTENKPQYEYPANFPMYGTLGSYAVSIGGAPSDTIVGLGMGTPEQPAFTIHTNFMLTFQRVKR